jgi:hypothetical protein
MSTHVLTPSSSAHRFWGANWQTSSHLVLWSKPRNHYSDFEAQIIKLSTLVLSPKPWTAVVVLRPNHWQTITTGFEARPENSHFSSPPRLWCGSHTTSPDLLIVRPPSTQLVLDHSWSSAPSLLLLPWSSSLPTTLHLLPTHHETSKHVSPNRITQFGVSSTEMHRIQIQTKSSPLLITQINQGTNHLISQFPPWWVHWQLQIHKVWIFYSRSNEAQLNDQKPKTSSKMVIQNKRIAKPKNWQESSKWQVEINGNAMKSLTLPLTILMQVLPLWYNLSYFPQTSINHSVSKRVLPLCAHSLPLWQWTHQTQTERSRCDAWDQN